MLNSESVGKGFHCEIPGMLTFINNLEKLEKIRKLREMKVLAFLKVISLKICAKEGNKKCQKQKRKINS